MDITGVVPIVTASGVVREHSTVKGLQYCDIAIAGAVTVYTKAVYVGLSKFHSLSYTAVSSAGGIVLKIEVEQSFKLPATEGSSDTYWAEPEGMGDIVANLVTESTIYHKSLALIPLPYFRLKITGGVGNSADTIVNAWLSKQENT
jgi:hypothetical protein